MVYSLGPMLAGKFQEERVQKLLDKNGHLYAQPKIDGFRLILWDGIARSRSWKAWTNRYLQQFAADARLFNGMDGEFFVGHTYRPEGFRDTMSGGRAEDGAHELGFYWFDHIGEFIRGLPYSNRLDHTAARIRALGDEHEGSPPSPYHMKHKVIPNVVVNTIDEIYTWEQKWLGEGFEGLILRTPTDPYKFGRGTPAAGPLIKLKRFDSAEAEIVGFEPWYHNANEATSSELGYTHRSSHLANQVALDRLGALICRSPVRVSADGSRRSAQFIEFKIGVFKGFTLSDRDRLWSDRESLIGSYAEFTHQGYGGGYEAPRTPVLLKIRPKIDVS